MIVCHCHRVTEHTIRETARSGAVTREAVTSRCGAGACCGGCRPAIDEILAEEAPAAPVRLVPLLQRSA